MELHKLDGQSHSKSRCPTRIARQLGVSRAAYDKAFEVITPIIAACMTDGGDQTPARQLRAEIAAAAALEALSVTGHKLRSEIDE